MAAGEVTLALAAVLLDLLLPAAVLLLLAGVSLALRRQGFGSLGVRRVPRPGRLVGTVFVLSVAWTLLTLPVLEHLTGERQDVSDFVDLEGDLALLAVMLLLSWTLAAVVEEVAFRGYLQTRVTEAVGVGVFALPLGCWSVRWHSGSSTPSRGSSACW